MAETTKRKGGRPHGAKTTFDPERHCGAKAKQSGKPCTRPKGFGTPHEGVGRCKYHGGLTPMTHGRYSSVTRSQANARYHELLDQLLNEANPLDLIPDLASLRARAILLQEEQDKDRKMLADWHESYTGKFRVEMRELNRLLRSPDPKELARALKRLREILDEMPPKPAKVWDPYAFVKAVTAMATLVEKITGQRERQQIPIRAVIDMQDKMAMVMMTELRKHFASAVEKGNKLAESIAVKWRDINIEF